MYYIFVGFIFNKNKVVINMTISEDKPEYMDTIDCYGDENYIRRSEKMKFIFEEKDDKIECDCDRYYYTFDSNGKSSGGTIEDIENNVIVFDKPENFNNMMDFSGDTKAK